MNSAVSSPPVFGQADPRWTEVFGRVLRIEGGYVNDKADRGGATKYGVSLRFLVIEGAVYLNSDGFKDFDLNLDGDITIRDVQLLTPEHAEALYHRCFWVQPGFWRLPKPYDAALFDFGVNAGTGRSVINLQKALNRHLAKPITVDAKLGPRTRGTLEELRAKGVPVLKDYRNEAAAFYRGIVARDASQKRFLRGWLARAEELGRV